MHEPPNILEHSDFWGRLSEFFLFSVTNPESHSIMPLAWRHLLFPSFSSERMSPPPRGLPWLLWFLWQDYDVFTDSSLRLWAAWGHRLPLTAESLVSSMGCRTEQLVCIQTKLPLELLALGKPRAKWCQEIWGRAWRCWVHLWLFHRPWGICSFHTLGASSQLDKGLVRWWGCGLGLFNCLIPGLGTFICHRHGH